MANAKEQHIRPYYINERELMDEYVMVMDSWDSNPIKVTNLEKTIIDMLRHKSPMVGIVDEMIRDYVVRKDKNIKKLIDYSYRFDVFKDVRERIFPYVKSTKNEKLNKREGEGI